MKDEVILITLLLTTLCNFFLFLYREIREFDGYIKKKEKLLEIKDNKQVKISEKIKK